MHTIAIVFSFLAFAGLARGAENTGEQKQDTSNEGSQTLQEVKFKDTDGDWVRLVIEKAQINQYVNNELVHRGIDRFKVDQDARTYTDNDGQGKFDPDEDLQKLAHSVDVLFRTQKNQKRLMDVLFERANTKDKKSKTSDGRKAEESKVTYVKYQGSLYWAERALHGQVTWP